MNQQKIQDFFTPRSKVQNLTNTNNTNNQLYIYTDGACTKNGFKNAKAGIGIYFGENDPRNISQRIEGKQTNNTAELSAIIAAYKIIQKDINLKQDQVTIFTDSEYAIKCATTYGEKCDKKKWIEEIPNKELVQTLFQLHKTNKSNIKITHIRAHTNKTDIHSLGNANADRLANESLI